MGDLGVDRLDFPAVRLVSFVFFAVIAGTLAAIFPARRAARLNVLDLQRQIRTLPKPVVAMVAAASRRRSSPPVGVG